MSRPRVTAICPTQPGRAWCFPLALAALGAQRDVQLDVIVGIAHGEPEPWTGTAAAAPERRRHPARPYVPLLGNLSGSRWIEYPASLTLGEKRAALCAAALEATGPFLSDWITFWDDDDWKPPHYLAQAVSRGQVTGRSVVGAGAALFMDLSSGRAYEYSAPVGELVGTSMVFHRDVLSKVAIPARDRGEDSMFVRACRDQGIEMATADGALTQVVAFEHGQRTGKPTWPPPLGMAEYRQVPVDWVADIMAAGGADLGDWIRAYQRR